MTCHHDVASPFTGVACEYIRVKSEMLRIPVGYWLIHLVGEATVKHRWGVMQELRAEVDLKYLVQPRHT